MPECWPRTSSATAKPRTWEHDGSQTLADQANLVVRVAQQVPGRIGLVGHSFGGTVGLKAATMLGDRVSHLFLFEPNLFHLLAQNGRADAYAAAMELRDFIKTHGAMSDWAAVAERFIDYWIGDGAWGTTRSSGSSRICGCCAQTITHGTD
jgi:pimeloyl-ACP methyl ester carboxylesterase